jgi:tRNA G18 (ribose-2'-O)-methylase SpoU
MPVIRIESLGDPRLDDYRNVSDAELVRRRGLFVGEGRLVVTRLLSSGHAVVSLLVNEPSFKCLEQDLAPMVDQVPVYVCRTADLAEIVGFNLHRGCLALARRPADRTVSSLVEGATLVLALENVTDADNVGSTFRNAAAFGADCVLLGACCDPLYRKAVRTSMGSVLSLPFARTRNLAADIAAMKAAGFTVVALTPDTRAESIEEFLARRVPVRTLLLVGNEGQGLSGEMLSNADALVRIPISAAVDSLNLATASAVALYAFTRGTKSASC